MTLKERARRFRKQFGRLWAAAGVAAGVAVGTLGIASPGCGQEQVVARGAFVNALRVNNPAFMVRLSLDHPDHVYVAGDRMVATVRSSSAGYLYLLYRDANGKVSCLFPNSEQKSNEIAASVDVVKVQVPPLSVQLPRVVPPSRKLTLPVAAAGLTVAVKAMAVP